MLANNETGVDRSRWPRSRRIAHAHGALYHCDAVQAAGKIPLDVASLGADLVTLSAHKLGGPPGVGALVVTGELDLLPMLRGGGQERGRRAGTENLPGIAGFAAAAEAAAAELASYDRVRALRDALEAEIVAAAPDAVVLGAAAPRLPNTVADRDARHRRRNPDHRARSRWRHGQRRRRLLIGQGRAEPCVEGDGGRRPILPPSTIRVSLGWSTTEADIDHFVDSPGPRSIAAGAALPPRRAAQARTRTRAA